MLTTARRCASAGKIFWRLHAVTPCNQTVTVCQFTARAHRKRHAAYALWPYSVRCFLFFLCNDAHALNVHELSAHLAFFT